MLFKTFTEIPKDVLHYNKENFDIQNKFLKITNQFVVESQIKQ